MRKSTLAAAIAVALFGSSAAIAQEAAPSTATPSTASQPQTSTPAPTTPEASGAGSGQAPVGTPPSNQDEHATSGGYYPYSSGTAGDDPAKPKTTTAVTPPGRDGDDDANAPTTAGWMKADTDGDEYLSRTEFEQAWPSLGARFDQIDVDRDKKLTRDELRTWHESQKARMEADQAAGAPAGTSPAPSASPSTAPTTSAPAAPADVPPSSASPANDAPTSSGATGSPETSGQ